VGARVDERACGGADLLHLVDMADRRSMYSVLRGAREKGRRKEKERNGKRNGSRRHQLRRGDHLAVGQSTAAVTAPLCAKRRAWPGERKRRKCFRV
jgi:hypothetical protein